jgi:hypothetical protein
VGTYAAEALVVTLAPFLLWLYAPMLPRVFQSLVEVFLLVEQPGQRLSHWTQALAPLDSLDAPQVASIDVYYDPASSQAIFRLRYDEFALGPQRFGFLVEVALWAEIGMIQPAELSEADRERFVGERLSRCTVHVADQREIVRALVELVRRVADQSSPSVDAVSPALPRSHAGVAPGRTRADTMEQTPVIGARGARNMTPAPSPPLPRAPRELAHGSVRKPKSHFVAETERSPGHRAKPEAPDQRSEGSAEYDVRGGRMKYGLLAETVSGQRMIPLVSTDAPIDVPTEPYLSAPGGAMHPDTIYARYLRSDRWVRTRIGALSLKGAVLMAGALPRVDDRIDIGLAYMNYRALVRGVVEKISTRQEAASTGATTFSLCFELDAASRRELTALLTAARTAGVTLKPPPLRSTRRYLVEWPITLDMTPGAVRAEVLDVSINGMFVKRRHALALDAEVTFSVVLDDGVVVSGRARVVRALSDADARAAGLSPGYGLRIIEMSHEDRERWCAFLTRIEQRAGKRVLIGAAPARLAELQNGLVAAGYAVTGGSEPSALAQLASGKAHPVDAALIDASWLARASSLRVESLFPVRKVPCVTVHGDVRRARIAVDQLLSVM